MKALLTGHNGTKEMSLYVIQGNTHCTEGTELATLCVQACVNMYCTTWKTNLKRA